MESFLRVNKLLRGSGSYAIFWPGPGHAYRKPATSATGLPEKWFSNRNLRSRKIKKKSHLYVDYEETNVERNQFSKEMNYILHEFFKEQ